MVTVALGDWALQTNGELSVPAFVATVAVPEDDPALVGAHTADRVQLAPTANAAGQLVAPKLQLVPVTVGGKLTLTGPTPVLLRVRVLLANWPT